MHSKTAAMLALAPLHAQDAAKRMAEKQLFAKIVEIPTVEGRTAEINSVIEQQALALADSPVLEKPFPLRTITETVRNLLPRAHGFTL